MRRVTTGDLPIFGEKGDRDVEWIGPFSRFAIDFERRSFPEGLQKP
jgi:hypothetical protein